MSKINYYSLLEAVHGDARLVSLNIERDAVFVPLANSVPNLLNFALGYCPDGWSIRTVKIGDTSDTSFQGVRPDPRIALLDAISALAPFAEMAEFYDSCEQHPNGCPDNELTGELVDLKVGELRRARSAFAILTTYASVMSAAPDLLDSLIELLEPLERACAAMVADGKVVNREGEAAFDRARRAIAKASHAAGLAPARDRG